MPGLEIEPSPKIPLNCGNIEFYDAKRRESTGLKRFRPALRGSDRQRHFQISPNRAGVEPLSVGMVDLPGRKPTKRLFERDAGLQSGQSRTDAEVNAVAERYVAIDAPQYIESVRVGVLALVVSGRRGE